MDIKNFLVKSIYKRFHKALIKILLLNPPFNTPASPYF